MVSVLADLFTTLGQNVTPDMIDCNQPAVEEALRRAARHFCTDTWAWREWQHGLTLAAAPTTAPTAVPAGTGVLTGAYNYATTNVTANGESILGCSSLTANPVSQSVNLTVIPLGPTGTLSRNIYRSVTGGDRKSVV